MDIADFANQCMEEFNSEAVTTTLLETPGQSSSGTPCSHCLECQNPIPVKRRELVPGCTLCVECADQKERQATLFAKRSNRQRGGISTSEQNTENSC